MNTKSTIKCPKCNEKLRVKIINDISKIAFEDIVSLKFLKCKCKKCEQVITLDYPFYFENKDFLITYNIDKCLKDKLSRNTNTINDFKEKYLILTDNLNDILMELIKDYVKKQTNIDGEIRYEGKTEESILFFLFKTKQDVKISLKFYEDLLNNSRFKNLDKATVVNSENYLNYIRLK